MSRKHGVQNRTVVYLRAFYKSLTWTLLVTSIGFLQVAMTFLICLIIKREFDFLRILQDGALYYFTLTLIAGIAIDYYFSEKLDLPKRIEGLIFALIPFVVAVSSASSFAIVYITEMSKIDVRIVTLIQYCVGVVGIIYALGIKFLLFTKLSSKK